MKRQLSPIQLHHLKRSLADKKIAETASEIFKMEKKFLAELANFYDTYADFRDEVTELYEKIATLRGPQGKPFLFSDFTSAQLRMLKGEPGRPGIPGKSVDIEKVISMVLEKIHVPQPQNGKTPKKGTDYFTSQEIRDIAAIAASMVKVKKETPEVDINALCEVIENKIAAKK